MSNLIEHIRQYIEARRFGKQTKITQATTTSVNAAMIEDEHAITLLMELLEQTKEGEYSCADTFDLLDEYVEIVADNEEKAATIMPYVRRHLDHCKGCTEQYESLLQVLQGS